VVPERPDTELPVVNVKGNPVIGLDGNPVDELVGHKQLCPFQTQGANPFSQTV